MSLDQKRGHDTQASMQSWLLTGTLFGAAVLAAQANPVKLVRQARVDIQASAAVGRIDLGTAPGGAIERMSWTSAGEQPRTYVAYWPVSHFAWREVRVAFTPQNNGWVTVDLTGPWEWSAESNAIYRQEVLWDMLAATGTTVPNGSFESVSGGVPTGWSNPWGGPVVIERSPPPVHGTNAVSVWHDRRLRTSIRVTGGVRVELRGYVRARFPEGFVDNPRILDPDSPAHRAARRFMRGINFGNVFEAPPGQDWGGGPIGPADLDAVRAQGFDHVRLPVRWSAHTGPGPAFTISNQFLQRVDMVVTGLLARGVGVILDVHHFDEFYSNPTAWTNKLYAIWDQLGRHYSNASDRLAFEILNEPRDQATTELMNQVYAQLLPRLRATNPHRTIFVAPGQWNSISELPALRLPADDANLIATVHLYDPYLFTHQGASWAGSAVATTNVVYPGPPPAPVTPHRDTAKHGWVAEWFAAYNALPPEANPCGTDAFESLLSLAREWANYYGRPVHVGEFGAYAIADAASRARYYRDMRAAMDRRGLGWAAWDWKAGFPYWHRAANAPLSGLRDALFPPPVLRWSRQPPALLCDLAAGKHVRLEHRPFSAADWTLIHAETLTSPLWRWEFPSALPDGMLRLVWSLDP